MCRKRMLMLATTAAMIEQFNKNNILILEEMGYEIHVAGNWEKGNPISDRRLDEFKEWLGEHHGKWFQISAVRNPIHLKENLQACQKVICLMKENKYTFVHCHTPIGSVIGRISAHITHTKMIYTAHGFHFYKGAPFKNWLLYYPVEYFLSKWTDVLITINREDYERAKRNFHMKRLEKIPGVGIDLARFGCLPVNRDDKRMELGIDNDTIVLLSVGELIERKNHRAIIRAVARLKRKMDIKIKYLIAGKGALENEYRELIKELQVEKEVQLLGFREDVSELCEGSDIFVFPSFQEGLPAALMEAMASGLPCIASNIRGNRDLILDEEGGYLVNADDLEGWTSKLEILIHNKSMQKAMGEVNKKVMKQYSSEIVSEMIRTNVYEGGGHSASEAD